jgi:hypothetical protein
VGGAGQPDLRERLHSRLADRAGAEPSGSNSRDQLSSRRTAVAEKKYDDALVELEAAKDELRRWQNGSLRFVPEQIDVETGEVHPYVEEQSGQAERPAKKLRTGMLTQLIETSTAVVRVKREREEAQEDLKDAEELNQTQYLFADRLQTKISELAELAKKSGADPAHVQAIVERNG